MNELVFDEIYLVGFRLHYESEYPELYSLVLDEEEEIIVTHENSLLFVADPSRVHLLYAFLDSERKRKYEVPTKMKKGIDVAGALYLLENEDEDRESIILDCLNMIFDVLNSIGVSLSGERKKILFGLADHLTFSDDLGGYLDSSTIDRETVLESLFWCVGKIVSKSRVL